MLKLIAESKEKFTPQVIEQLSSYFGESETEINHAVDLILPVFVRVIGEYSNTKKDTIHLLNIVNEGGHASDLFDDLNLVFSDYDKTQLLSTIGSSVNKQFYNEKFNAVMLHVADELNLKKSSVSSLLNFVSPIVFSTLSKKIRQENISLDDLQKTLKKEKNFSADLIEPGLQEQLGLFSEKVKKIKELNEPSEIMKLKPIAWVLALIALLLSIWYYTVQQENKDEDEEILNSLNKNEALESIDSKEKIKGFNEESK